MARSRNLKPGFFTDAELVDCEIWVRLLFAGLWTLADREGRLLDKPKQIGIELFPRDRLDIDAGLTDLEERGFIVRYEVNGVRIIQVRNFAKHQNPHKEERASILPAQGSAGDYDADTVQAPGNMAESTGQSAIKPSTPRADSLPLIPSSPIPDTGFPVPPQAPRSRGEVAEVPYAMWSAFCEAAGYEIAAATPQEKGRSLKTAQRLIEAGVTVAEVAACTRYLASQSWRTGVLSLTTVANEIGKWRMAGRPEEEKPRAKPNGRYDPNENLLRPGEAPVMSAEERERLESERKAALAKSGESAEERWARLHPEQAAGLPIPRLSASAAKTGPGGG